MKFLKNLPYGDLNTMTLVFDINDYDRFGRNDKMGEVQVALGHVDLGKVIQEWRDVKPPAGENENEVLGDICFSLRYVPTAGKLTVVVIEAKNLKKMDVGGLSGIYSYTLYYYTITIHLFTDCLKILT